MLIPQEPAVRIELTTVQLKNGSGDHYPAVLPEEAGDGSTEIRRLASPSAAKKPNEQPTVYRPCVRCGTDDRAQFGTRVRRGKVVPQPYCRTCQVEYHRAWRGTVEGREKMRQGVTASRKRYPERQAVRVEVRKALLRGELQAGPCYAASSDCLGAVEAHHDDYAKPLSVIWTCRRHHRALDRSRRARHPEPTPPRAA